MRFGRLSLRHEGVLGTGRDDSDFSLKSEEMCNFFKKRGYPASVVQAGHHRAQQIDRQSALQTSQRYNNDRIPLTLTFHPHNHAVKSIILKKLQNDSDIGSIFSQPPLISSKCDKNIGNFLVRSVFQTSDQPGTFKCARTRCKTCPFIRKVDKISGPKRSIKITDHFTCTSAKVIYCITCTHAKSYTSAKQGDDLETTQHGFDSLETYPYILIKWDNLVSSTGLIM